MTTIHRPEAGRSLLIGGTARAGGAGTLPVENPATGEVIAHVADGDGADATAAVDAAHAALAGWRNTPARTRSEALTRSYELMLRNRDDLVAPVDQCPLLPVALCRSSARQRHPMPAVPDWVRLRSSAGTTGRNRGSSTDRGRPRGPAR